MHIEPLRHERGHDLIPHNTELPALYEQEGADPLIAHLKLFTPMSIFTHYILEYDPDTRTAFAWTHNAQIPMFSELGYISLDEIAHAKVTFGRGVWMPAVERDLHFAPQPLPAIQAEHGIA